MNVPAAASNQAILATSPGSINNAQTATPKRRRKENGAGSPRVRYSPDKKSYSPDKKSHLRTSISQAGSLLDDNHNIATLTISNTRRSSSRNRKTGSGSVGTTSRASSEPGGVATKHQQQELVEWEPAAAATRTESSPSRSVQYYWMEEEEEEQSQLVGVSIPLPQSPTSPPPVSSLVVMHNMHMHHQEDDLSYSDSEASPPNVIKDLSQELLWEKLMEEDDAEDMGKSLCGESYESLLEQEGFLSSLPGTTSPIPLHPIQERTPVATGAKAPTTATKRTIQTDLFQQGFLMSPPRQSVASISNSPHSLALSTSPPTIMEYTSTGSSSLVGEVIAVSVTGPEDEDEADRRQVLLEQQQQQRMPEPYILSSSSLLPSPRKFDLDCRQVSEFSELTMEDHPTTKGMVHLKHNISSDEDEDVLQVTTTNMEASVESDSSRECLSSEDEERYENITLSSAEGLRSSSSYTSSSSFSSTTTYDMEGDKHNNIRHDKGQTRGAYENYHGDFVGSSSHYEQQQQQDLPSGRRFRSRSSRHSIGFPTENQLLRPAETSPSKSWSKKSKGSPKERGASHRRQRNGEPKHHERQNRGGVTRKSEKEPSILVDLSKDIKDAAIMAGKSSEKIVTNLFHSLYEETTNNKWTYL